MLSEVLPDVRSHFFHNYGVKVTQLYPTLCHPTDCSPQGSSVRGVFQTRILVAISFSRWSFHPGIEPVSLASPALAGRFFTIAPPGKPIF